MSAPTIVYVDVDDTLIRSYGSKRIPLAGVVEQVRLLHADGQDCILGCLDHDQLSTLRRVTGLAFELLT